MSTTPPTQQPPAGWYDDPQVAGQLRYWDGAAWTEHTHVPSAPPQVAPPPAAAGAPGAYAGYRTELADFGARFVAMLIDGLVLSLVLGVVVGGSVLLVLAAAGGGNDGMAAGAVILMILFVLVALVAGFGYGVLFEGGRYGQTIGKWVMNIRVTGADRQSRISYGKSLGRALVKGFLSGAIFYLGYLWMLWDEENRTWHDLLPDTRVVRAEGPKPSLGQLVGSSLRRT